MKTNIVRKCIGYTGLCLTILVSFYLLFYVGINMYLYDVEFSDGTDDARWTIQSLEWDSTDTILLLMWGFYLLVTGIHLCLYFKRLISMNKFNVWALPTFNIGSMRLLSFILSVLFVLFVIFFHTFMPEVYTPCISREEYKEMSYYEGIDSFWAVIFFNKWMIFTFFTSIHLFLYMATRNK